MKARDIPPVVERLLDALGVQSVVDAATELGVAHSTMYNWIGKGEVPDVYLMAAALRSGRPIEWLRTGAGPERDKLSARERDLLRCYRAMDEVSRRCLDHVSRLMAAAAVAEAPGEVETAGAKDGITRAVEMLELNRAMATAVKAAARKKRRG